MGEGKTYEYSWMAYHAPVPAEMGFVSVSIFVVQLCNKVGVLIRWYIQSGTLPVATAGG